MEEGGVLQERVGRQYNLKVNWFSSHAYVAEWASVAITVGLALFKKNRIYVD